MTSCFYPYLIVLMSYSNVKMSQTWRKMYDHIADVNAQVEDAVSGVRVVQSFTNEQHEMDQFAENNNLFRSAKLMAYRVMAIVHSNIYLVMRFAILFVLVVGAWLSFNDQLS